MLVIWTAFFLYSATDVIVRFYEGYPLSRLTLKSKKKQTTNAWQKKNLPALTNWQKQLKAFSKKGFDEKSAGRIIELVFKALGEIASVSLQKPLNPEFLMPTRLGNVLRSSEMYAFDRYAIVDTAIWPRLLPVLPREITKHLEEKNNLFMFLLNSSFLAYIISFISTMAFLLGICMPIFPQQWGFDPQTLFFIGYKFIPVEGYGGLSIVALIFGYMLYRIAVNAAEDFSMYIRASFDLYRINLLRQLNWEPPQTLEAEKTLWLEICKFLIAGELIPFDFSDHPRIFYQQANDSTQASQEAERP